MEQGFTVKLGETIHLKSKYAPADAKPSFQYVVDPNTEGAVQVSASADTTGLDVFGGTLGAAEVEATCDGVTEVLRFTVVPAHTPVTDFHFVLEDQAEEAKPEAAAEPAATDAPATDEVQPEDEAEEQAPA